MQSPAAALIGLSRSEKYNTDGGNPCRLSFLDTASAAIDFGRIYHHKPAAILRPVCAEEIARFLRAIYASRALATGYRQEYLSVSAKGAGHSIHGQAQAPDGLVIEMSSLRGVHIHVADAGGGSYSYADVAAGELWVDLLAETMKLGLAPRSWTDYLYLSVGGTLSNAGISGQTFRHGPQISNVLQLDIITGTGELITCSPAENADLFYASMGGLGQFGVITRARIILEPAPQKVKWVRALYSDFEQFTRDQELLVSMDDGAATVDYLEGFVVVNNEAMHSWSISFPAATPLDDSVFNDAGTEILFCIEIAKYFTQSEDETADVDKVTGRIISRLTFIPGLIYSVEVPYADFLNRVRVEELNLRSRGLWDVPHPWFNMFVPRRQIQRFTTSLLKIMSPDTVKGPILVYPVKRSKWNTNMSAVIPEDKDEIFYAVGVLRSADPLCLAGSSCLNDLLSQNQQIIDLSTKANEIVANDKTDTDIGAKQYLAHHSHEWQWKNHFGSKWGIFLQRKARYDPLNILAPGQRILNRNRP